MLGKMAIAVTVIGLVVSGPARGAETREVRGTVVSATDDAVVIQTGTAVQKFRREGVATLHPVDGIKTGDRITVRYSVEVREVRVEREDEPGAPADARERGNESDGAGSGVIIDDRAFLNARAPQVQMLPGTSVADLRFDEPNLPGG